MQTKIPSCSIVISADTLPGRNFILVVLFLKTNMFCNHLNQNWALWLFTMKLCFVANENLVSSGGMRTLDDQQVEIDTEVVTEVQEKLQMKARPFKLQQTSPGKKREFLSNYILSLLHSYLTLFIRYLVGSSFFTPQFHCFYPTASKGCTGIVFTHGGRAFRLVVAAKSLSGLYLRNLKV